ncbi:collagen alpha-1(III) chain-like, partial [Amphibalanus amphitrite]|uniref:collagen alpha-1(III) chain-like n=1 Tax=Amphibalanus amphitrite TaxID=1232801 RepID=UPI001C922401
GPVTAAAASGGAAHLEHCQQLAQPLVTETRMVVPATHEELATVCRNWRLFVDCINKFVMSGYSRQQKLAFNGAVQTAVKSVHKMCSDPDYSKEYLEHAPCIQKMTMDKSRCGEDYTKMADAVINAAPDSDVCCRYLRFRSCVAADPGCADKPSGNRLTMFVNTFLDNGLQVFVHKCHSSLFTLDSCDEAGSQGGWQSIRGDNGADWRHADSDGPRYGLRWPDLVRDHPEHHSKQRDFPTEERHPNYSQERTSYDQERSGFSTEYAIYGPERSDYFQERSDYEQGPSDFGSEHSADYHWERVDSELGSERTDDRQRSAPGRRQITPVAVDEMERHGGRPSADAPRLARGEPARAPTGAEHQEHGQLLRIQERTGAAAGPGDRSAAGPGAPHSAGQWTELAPRQEHEELMKAGVGLRPEGPDRRLGGPERPYIIPDRPDQPAGPVREALRAEVGGRRLPDPVEVGGRRLPDPVGVGGRRPSDPVGVGGAPAVSVSSPDGWSRLLPAGTLAARGRPAFMDRIDRPARRDGSAWRRDGADPQRGGTDSQWDRTDPRWGGTDPQQGGTDPQRGGTDPQRGGTDPRRGGTDPEPARGPQSWPGQPSAAPDSPVGQAAGPGRSQTGSERSPSGTDRQFPLQVGRTSRVEYHSSAERTATVSGGAGGAAPPPADTAGGLSVAAARARDRAARMGDGGRRLPGPGSGGGVSAGTPAAGQPRDPAAPGSAGSAGPSRPPGIGEAPGPERPPQPSSADRPSAAAAAAKDRAQSSNHPVDLENGFTPIVNTAAKDFSGIDSPMGSAPDPVRNPSPSRGPAADSSRDPVIDLARDSFHNTIQNTLRDQTRDSVPEPAHEPVRDPTQTESRDPFRESSNDQSGDPFRSPANDQPSDPARSPARGGSPGPSRGSPIARPSPSPPAPAASTTAYRGWFQPQSSTPVWVVSNSLEDRYARAERRRSYSAGGAPLPGRGLLLLLAAASLLRWGAC